MGNKSDRIKNLIGLNQALSQDVFDLLEDNSDLERFNNGLSHQLKQLSDVAEEHIAKYNVVAQHFNEVSVAADAVLEYLIDQWAASAAFGFDPVAHVAPELAVLEILARALYGDPEEVVPGEYDGSWNPPEDIGDARP